MHRTQNISQGMSEQERLNWLRLIRTDNVGPITFFALLEKFGSAGEALHQLPDLAKRGGRSKPLTPPPEHDIEREISALRKFGGQLLTVMDEDYPQALAQIDDAPPVIAVIGKTDLLHRPCLGIVGARNASMHGRRLAEKLARDLGSKNYVIASGLARGIDTAAHTGSLNSGTIAVVAGGLDVVYPEENRGLYEQICENGCVVAESPFGQTPYAQSFPKRNRIISGLSQGVVVVEASLRSGSLITARMAGEQGRDVYAVPGFPDDPRAQGPNSLIQNGATLVQSADDILGQHTLFPQRGEHKNELKEKISVQAALIRDENIANDRFDNEGEETPPDILDHLSHTPIHLDALARACQVSIATLHSAVLEYELSGQVQRLPGNKISLV